MLMTALRAFWNRTYGYTYGLECIPSASYHRGISALISGRGRIFRFGMLTGAHIVFRIRGYE